MHKMRPNDFVIISALLGLIHNVGASHFYGIQLAVDLIQNASAGVVVVNFHWREIWNTTSTLSTSTDVNTCYTGSTCPSGPNYITMNTGTSNCQQTVTSANGEAYDSRTGVDTSTYFRITDIPATTTYYSMEFDGVSAYSFWGLIEYTSALYGAEIKVLISRRTDTGLFDNSARSAIAPIVTIRPACGGTGFQIPYYDPDGDPVKCRWGSTTLECQDVCYNIYINYYYYSLPFTLSTDCNLTYTGGLPTSSTYYPISVMLEDYYPLTPTVKMDSAPLQFVVEVAPPNSPCVPVSPLVVDSCCVAMAPVKICPENITNAPANSYVSFSQYTGYPKAAANVNCNNGYVAMPNSSIYMICLASNATTGFWTAVGNCTAIVGYCNSNPNATVSNSVVVGSYETTVSSTAKVGCAIGYSGSGSSSTATCTSYNQTNGYWDSLSYSCTRMPPIV